MSIPFHTPSFETQLFSVVTSFIKDDLLFYDNSVAAIDTKCPNNNF